ncbi:MAG TPA: ATP-binding protein [Bryobacteraceae bacterium]|nr:ATP-binding protein [Bryobacteraceae bacterium]
MNFAGTVRGKRTAAFGLVLGLLAVAAWLAVRQPKVEDRVYRIGFENSPPVHFIDKDGRATGLAVELVREAARRRGIRLQWLVMPESSDAALNGKKVDLWPMMTIRPERKGVVYITEPYAEGEFCLLVRHSSTYRRLEDLRNSTVSYDGTPLYVKLLRTGLPNAKLEMIGLPKASIEAVCSAQSDAAFLTEYTAVETLLAGVSCGSEGLRVIQLPELRGFLGVGATFDAKPAADAIREEIGAMAADGTTAGIVSRWRSFSGRNMEIAEELLRAKRTQRRLVAGISVAILLLLLVLWQAIRIRLAQTAMVEKNRELGAALAAAKEATELKSQFLANMSHEIRTPMNAILGMTGLAMDTPDRAEEREYLRDVMNSARSLLTLLNDILDLSKIEAGKLTFDMVDFDPGAVACGVCSMLAEEARRKGLELTCRLPDHYPHELRGDPARLRQTLVNLVGNAIKFTEKGNIDLQVSVDALSDRSATLRFAVTDTGIGISEDAQRRIFESFAQADGQVARKYGGTGLGLAISRELIAKMGGELQVESALGRGSTFWFTLPFEMAHKSTADTESRSDQQILDA